MNPSGSALERATACAASYALPQASYTGDAAIRGTENHDAIETSLALGGDLSKQPRVVRELLEDATWVETEIAFAIDVAAETVRVIGRRIGRNYGPLNPTEIPLTVDAVVGKPGELLVIDWKSRKRVSAASKNLQLRAAAVAAMKWKSAGDVVGVIAYLDDGEKDAHAFDTFDVGRFFLDMREMLHRISLAKALVSSGGTPSVHAGPWCEYCPAMSYCPAQTRLALQMMGELDYVQKQVAFMSPEQVGKAWMLLKSIQGLAEKVDASLRLRAQQGVIPLPNGKRLAMVDKSRSSFDKKKATAWIQAHGGDPKDFEGRTYFTQISEVKMTGADAVPTDHE